MLATYKYVFNRKNERLTRGKTALVQLRVTISRRQRYFTTGIYLERQQWSGKDNAWVVCTPLAADYNALLLEIITKIRRAEVQAAQAGRALSHEVIQSIIKADNADSFVDFMLNECGRRGDVGEGTKKHVQAVANKLRRLGITDFADLTLENIQRANAELLKESMESTVDKFHATVACYVARAVRLDMLPMDKNPYLKFTRKRPKYLNRKYLTEQELRAIEEKECSIERLQFIKDMFLFCCYTGLSYGDLQALKPSSIVPEGGRVFIKTFRKKTSEKSVILLLNKARDILQKYSGRRSGYCFPSITNQRLNAYLKEIADLAGVEKNLTFHVSRHTFATTVMLMNGASIEVTQKALGHASIATTQLYAKMVDSRVADEMGAVERKLEGK
ncbi:MAG: tyrosine-type recombinase/integrase [Prevotellaceae bacterium]|jgi:integrase|nr:tyrosine-type recombinase/integrase [Prevotellaceae bacterium]